MQNNIKGHVSGEGETKKSVSIKVKPGIIEKARLSAVSSDKRLGDWPEEAVEERAAREEKRTK